MVQMNGFLNNTALLLRVACKQRQPRNRCTYTSFRGKIVRQEYSCHDWLENPLVYKNLFVPIVPLYLRVQIEYHVKKLWLEVHW